MVCFILLPVCYLKCTYVIDPDAAFNYVYHHYPEIFDDDIQMQTDDNATEQVPVEQPVETVKDILWTKKKPTDRDCEATSLLLALRQKMADQFDDKKNTKAKLWQKIAGTLKENNFSLGDKAADRCRQKFANLTKSYLSYVKQQQTTGEGKIDPPPFFDEMHSILGK